VGGAIYHIPHMPSWLAEGLHLYCCPVVLPCFVHIFKLNYFRHPERKDKNAVTFLRYYTKQMKKLLNTYLYYF
jgi:hypothetical protein